MLPHSSSSFTTDKSCDRSNVASKGYVRDQSDRVDDERAIVARKGNDRDLYQGRETA